MIKLSIIIPVHNMRSYLTQCVNSILSQSFSNFEIILVDDGSTDGSSSLCDYLKSTDSRIKVLHIPNGGVSKARNCGIDSASGQFITFIDSDDFLEDSCLFEDCLPLLDEGFDCVRYNIRTFGLKNDYTILPIKNYQYTFDSKIAKEKFIKDVIFGYKIGHEVCTAFFSRQIILKNNIVFPTGINFGEDLYFSILYSFYSNSVYYVGSKFYTYRMRPGSMMRKSAGKVKINEMNDLSFNLYKKLGDKIDEVSFAEIHFSFLNNQLNAISNYLKISNLRKVISSTNSISNKQHFERFNKLYYEHYKLTTKKNYHFFKQKILLKYLSDRRKIAFITSAFLFLIFVFPFHILTSLFKKIK